MAEQVSGGTAVAANRMARPEILDFFPTPPWATRALFEHVMPVMGVHVFTEDVRDPCCGQMHMAEVISEYSSIVHATDIHDYGVGGGVADFLNEMVATLWPVGWHIFNPPFNYAEAFVHRALKLSTDGVCALVRMQWIEGQDRYANLFRDNPPTLIAPFVERVPMVEGRWDPDASTATSYAWFCWRKSHEPRAPFWIPPCSRALTRPTDRQRFAAWTQHADDYVAIEDLARELCARDGVDPRAATQTHKRNTLTYRQRRTEKGGSTIISAMEWAARRRVADDMIALNHMVKALAA